MRRDILLAGVAGAIVGSWLTLIAVQFSGHGFSLPGRGSNVSMADNHPAAKPAPAAVPAATAKADTAPPQKIETPKLSEPAKQDAVATSQPKPDEQAKAEPAKPAPMATPEKADPTADVPAAADVPASITTAPASVIQPPDAAMLAAATVVSSLAIDGAGKAPAGETAKAEDNKPATPASTTPQANKVVAEAVKVNDTPAKPAETPPLQPATATVDAAKSSETAPAEAAKPAEAATNKPDAAAVSPPPAPADQAKTDLPPDNRIPADQIDRQKAATEHRTLGEQPQPAPQSKPTSEPASIDPSSQTEGHTATIELVRPFADLAGILTIGGRSVQLNGVIPTDVERMCTGPSGKNWPCGQAARTAFRMYLRGRSIDCDVPDAAWKGTVKANCRYVRVDLSAWLVRFGWADPEPGSPLASLVDEAKEKKRGMYGDDPRKNGKSTLAPALPKEDPLNPI